MAEDLFTLQSEITKRIVRSLESELSPRERERVEDQPTGGLVAYRLYVEGRFRLDERSGESMQKAAKSFRWAPEFDPDLAEAHAFLAFTLKGRYLEAAALRPLEQSVELQPRYAQAHHWLGRLLPPLGRLERAEEQASLALASLGQTDTAFSAFRREDSGGGWATTGLRYWFPRMLQLHRDELRSGELIREVNRAWGLNPGRSLSADGS